MQWGALLDSTNGLGTTNGGMRTGVDPDPVTNRPQRGHALGTLKQVIYEREQPC